MNRHTSPLTRRAFFPVLAASAQIAAPSRRNRLLLGGDVMLSRYVGKLAKTRHDPSWPLRDLAPFLREADIAFVNLESPFSDRGPIANSGMVFKAEPEMIATLTNAGIAVVSTANNHSRDCGRHGVEFTVDWLARHNIAAVGSGVTADAAHAGAILERRGVRFGFLGYTFDQSNGNYKDADDRVALMDVARMRADVARMRQRAEVTIVSMHAGTEYSPHPNARQIEFARAAIDAGARLVAGHHPHVVEPWERYGSGVIFYSLGNLVFDQFQRRETQRGVIADVIFNGATLVSASLLPVEIVRTAPRLASASVAGRPG